ncbi:MAG TPA: metallophosphoesterase [Gemmatimonadaceae bacterium]|jgi:predicted MPP superfamily phosphohydrolase|nr:metallophosphoesterase [Gemmatimonadaceae bacterium]
MSRRQWLAGAASIAAASAAANAFAIEPGRVAVTRHRVGSATGSVPLRVTQLSDLHLRSVGAHEERIAHAVTELQPHLVVVTGDAIDRAGNLGMLDRFLALIPHVPKLAILGNWEYWGHVDRGALTRVYEKWNCRLLCNESTVVAFASRDLVVTGLDDLVGGRPDSAAAFAGLGAMPNHLLLAHCPMHRDVYRAGLPSGSQPVGVSKASPAASAAVPQIMLAGHTHGGQIAPFGWAPIRPRGSGRYVSGWYNDAPTSMYVSRGLGTSVVPARLGAVPEIAHFEWALAAT